MSTFVNKQSERKSACLGLHLKTFLGAHLKALLRRVHVVEHIFSHQSPSIPQVATIIENFCRCSCINYNGVKKISGFNRNNWSNFGVVGNIELFLSLLANLSIKVG